MVEYRVSCDISTPEVFQSHLDELKAMGIVHNFDPSIYTEGEGCHEVLLCNTKTQKKWIKNRDWLIVVDNNFYPRSKIVTRANPTTMAPNNKGFLKSLSKRSLNEF